MNRPIKIKHSKCVDCVYSNSTQFFSFLPWLFPLLCIVSLILRYLFYEMATRPRTFHSHEVLDKVTLSPHIFLCFVWSDLGKWPKKRLELEVGYPFKFRLVALASPTSFLQMMCCCLPKSSHPKQGKIKRENLLELWTKSPINWLLGRENLSTSQVMWLLLIPFHLLSLFITCKSIGFCSMCVTILIKQLVVLFGKDRQTRVCIWLVGKKLLSRIWVLEWE